MPTTHAQQRAIERFGVHPDEAAGFLITALCGDGDNESAAFVPRHRWEFYKWGYHPTATDELHAAMYVNRFSWRGHDHQIQGGYCIDRTQLEWLAQDLAANRDKLKVAFCHEELHVTPPEGSGEGGDAPFLQKGKLYSYVDNGWQVRELLRADGNVLACFFGHKHCSRWVVYGGVNYITLAAMFKGDGYTRVTISDKLYIEGSEGRQRSYTMLIAARLQERTSR